jgi:hypothetical protein
MSSSQNELLNSKKPRFSLILSRRGIHVIAGGIIGCFTLVLLSIWLWWTLYLTQDWIRPLLQMTFLPTELNMPRLETYFLSSSRPDNFWKRVIHGFLLGALTTLAIVQWRKGNHMLAANLALRFGALLSIYLFWDNFSPLLTYSLVVPRSVTVMGAIFHVFLYQSEFQWALFLLGSGCVLCRLLKRKKKT